MGRLFVPGLVLTTVTVATASAQTSRPQLVVLTAKANLQAERLWLPGEHLTWANDGNVPGPAGPAATRLWARGRLFDRRGPLAEENTRLAPPARRRR